MPNRPRFSIVSAACDVSQHLPEFIDSIERQTIGFDAIEVIAVDDGSTDDSRDILEAWAARHPDQVRVLRQPNAGAAAARNLGLAAATGDWVTFSDPDDELDPEALAVADAFTRANPHVQVMAMRQQLIDEERGVIREPGLRNAPFEAGDRVVDLDRDPETLIGSSSASLYRLDRIRTTGMTFDPRIRVVEDGHFAMRFVLELDRPTIGLLGDARYRHRLPRDQGSSREARWDLPDRYGTTLELGFVDLVERSTARHGSVPAWLQAQLLYELSYYLFEDARMGSRSHLPPELSDRFHDLFGRLVRELDPELVRRFDVPPYEHRFDDIVIHAYRDTVWQSETASVTRVDEKMALQRIEYHYGGPPPVESILIDGRPAAPAWSKTVTVTCFGREVMTERLLWLPTGGDLEIRLEGVALPVETPDPAANPTNSITRRRARRRAHRRARNVAAGAVRERRGLRARFRLRARLRSTIARARRATFRMAAFSPIGNHYRNAWVFIDRVYTANDNAERLFDHVRAHRPDINAWFVVEEGSDAWRRLREARVERLVAYGSRRWRMLMLRSAWVVSSHVDDAISAPIRLVGLLDRPTWRMAFLQHGVIKDDLASWFNVKELELFVTSTDDELRSIVTDGTRYRLTPKECRNIGLPRWDRLLELGRAVDEAQRDLVVIMPTWRMWLTLPRDGTNQKRGIRDSIWDSDYLRSWLAILGSDEIAAAAARNGRQLLYIPHPNIRPILEGMRLPAHVRAVPIDGDDVQSLFARTALFVTDYSSACFDAAVLDRPIVYYQFDRERTREGGHIGRHGYFEYERDGFGPVVFDHAAAVAAIVAALDAGPRAAPEYQRRIDATFPQRDGRGCERAVAAIEEMSRPWRPPSPPAAGGVPDRPDQARRA